MTAATGCRFCSSEVASCDTSLEASGCPLCVADDERVQRNIWQARCSELLAERDRLTWALQRVYVWISPEALREDEDTVLTEARRMCREALGVRAE
jgi:hypothetical protein